MARGKEGVRRMYRCTYPASCMYTPSYRVPSTLAETRPLCRPQEERRAQLRLSAGTTTRDEGEDEDLDEGVGDI